jgi:hypothetical protein
VFIGVDTGVVYSLDAASGCMYWSFKSGRGCADRNHHRRINRVFR